MFARQRRELRRREDGVTRTLRDKVLHLGEAKGLEYAQPGELEGKEDGGDGENGDRKRQSDGNGNGSADQQASSQSKEEREQSRQQRAEKREERRGS